MRDGTPPAADRWLVWWLVGLNIALVLAAVALGIWVTRRALFLIALVPIAFAPFAYARWRAQQFLREVLQSWGRSSALVAVLAGAGMVLDLLMAGQLLTARSSILSSVLHAPGTDWIGPVWFSAHALLFLGYTLVGICRSASRALAGLMRRFRTSRRAAVVQEPMLGRRELLQQFGIVGVGAPFALSLSSVPLSYDFRVEERAVELPGWPPQLDGLRVAHLSDIHVGGAMNRERLLRVAALTNAARPDLVLHTGDFLTHRSGDFDAPLYEALALIRAPYGQFACLGNHDYDDPDRLVRRLRDAGVIVLRHQVVTVAVRGQSVEVCGLDYLSPRLGAAERYNRVFNHFGSRSGHPRLLLNHDPSAFALLPDGCADLVLSGHTHGGHIGIQLGPDKALTVVGLVGIPDQGIFHRDGMMLHVTRCVGFYGYPMRLGIPPEIALLTLRGSSPAGHQTV